jgi:LCP family protein required for cell wall assembly
MAKHGAESDPAPARHPVRRVFVVLGLVMALLVVAGGAGAYLIYRDLNNNITREDLLNSSVLGTNRPTKVVESGTDQQPLNILVMGSDTRQGQGGGYGNDVTGARSDTTMLVHISADRTRLEVVSIPRDTIVDIPSCTTPTGTSAPFRDRFNAAFSIGGPGCTIKTVEQNTGVFVDHFVVVDFRGFQNMIDAIGKVRVCLPEAVNDPKSKLNLPAGYSEVDGKQALAYVRTRYSIGNGSDISRIDRQQAFASSVISKVTSAGVLLNPAKLLGFLRAATKSITTDPQLGSLNQMRELAQQVRGIPPKNVTFVTTPWIVNPDDPNTVVWDPSKIDALWSALKNDTAYPPPAPKPAVIDGGAITAAPDTISVSVLNGTSRSGAAGKVGDKLSKQGYHVVAVDNADSSSYVSTVIRYDPAYGTDAARTLAAALPGASRLKAPGLGSTVQVVVGRDFGGVDAVTVQAPPDPNEHIRRASQNICS